MERDKLEFHRRWIEACHLSSPTNRNLLLLPLPTSRKKYLVEEDVVRLEVSMYH
jgi:hypothetical protein